VDSADASFQARNDGNKHQFEFQRHSGESRNPDVSGITLSPELIEKLQ
jgi:hypothetical protein